MTFVRNVLTIMISCRFYSAIGTAELASACFSYLVLMLEGKRAALTACLKDGQWLQVRVSTNEQWKFKILTWEVSKEPDLGLIPLKVQSNCYLGFNYFTLNFLARSFVLKGIAFLTGVWANSCFYRMNFFVLEAWHLENLWFMLVNDTYYIVIETYLHL